MKITTIDKKLVNTDKLPDVQSEMIELIEKSGILKFAGEQKGACFVWCELPTGEGWVTQLIKDDKDLNNLLKTVNDLVKMATGNKLKIAVVDKDF